MNTTTKTVTKVKFIKLRSPEGDLFIRIDAITALAEVQHSQRIDLVKTEIFVEGQQEPFNTLQTIGEVANDLGKKFDE